MKKGATTDWVWRKEVLWIVALRNEKGSYNAYRDKTIKPLIVALRNEKGSYNLAMRAAWLLRIVALRNEKGSYNRREREN